MFFFLKKKLKQHHLKKIKKKVSKTRSYLGFNPSSRSDLIKFSSIWFNTKPNLDRALK